MTTTVGLRRLGAFWAVAGLSALWNGFGAYDFIMTNVRDHAYLAQFPVSVIDYLDEMPLWALMVWAVGVWGALAGSLLMLGRSRQAVLAFALSLIGLAASTLRQIIEPMPAEMRTPPMIAMTVAIWAAAVFLLWFAWRAWRRGVLQ